MAVDLTPLLPDRDLLDWYETNSRRRSELSDDDVELLDAIESDLAYVERLKFAPEDEQRQAVEGRLELIARMESEARLYTVGV